jgi:hypothetical protein
MAATAFFARSATAFLSGIYLTICRTSVLSTSHYFLNLYRVGVLKLFINLQQILIIRNSKESV